MRIHAALTLSILAAAAIANPSARAAGWVHATVTVKPAAAGTTQPASPPPVEYYFNDDQRMAAVVSTEDGDKGVQFMAPSQGYMDTYSSKRNEILHSELTKSAILPQDGALPTSLEEALKGASAFLGTDAPKDAVAVSSAVETHILTAGATGPKLTLKVDPVNKRLFQIEQVTPEATTTIVYDYRPVAMTSIYDFGLDKNTVKTIDNLPSAAARELLDQLDARVEKNPGDGVAVITTDPQSIGPRGERPGHDKTQPYTVELFGASAGSFVYRVHSIQQAPAGNMDQILAALQPQPATSFVVYDGKSLSQLTYDPQSGKASVSDRAVKLEPKDFAATNYQRRVFLGRDALGTLIPVSKTELVEDPKARPGQKAIKVTRPTTLYYQDDKNQTQSVPATQLTVYWVDPSRGYAPVEYYERRDPAANSGLKPEVLSTKFTDFANTPDGSAIPTRWETGTWDIHGNTQVTAFTLRAAFNKKLDAVWFTKPALPPASPPK